LLFRAARAASRVSAMQTADHLGLPQVIESSSGGVVTRRLHAICELSRMVFQNSATRSERREGLKAS
jgi:hypothetical protein